ncbi:MAG: hypothetical protein LBI02_05065 [Opitutaceae bacterium]|nr:hypothetical protein [Opitutaceae bacterium]
MFYATAPVHWRKQTRGILPRRASQAKPLHPRLSYRLSACPIVISLDALNKNQASREIRKNPPLPAAPLLLSDKTEIIELVPYGATRLRWTVFPEAQ